MTPLYKPYMPADLPEIDNILHSGALAYGRWGRLLEKSLKDFIGCEEDVLVVNSYTAALQVMLAAIGVEPGDEIIASPQCCLASTQPLATYGAKVIWADINPQRGTLDPDSVERKISSRTKLIFHNHHCSYPGFIDEVNEIGHRHGIPVVDDCIEAFGAKYKGKLLGNLGTDVTTLSFQTVRLPNTIDGGAVIFKDKSFYQRAVRMRDLGVDRTTFRDNIGEINPYSDVPTMGYGVTMNEICSYVGYTQMLDIPDLLDRQRDNAKKWREELSEETGVCFLDTTDIEPAYWVFGLLVDDKLASIKKFREKGWHASGVHVPNTFYSRFGNQGEFPGVNEFYARFHAIPSGWWVDK